MEKIGRYEIRGELGRGGMATVYRAYDPLSDREVAIKVLPSHLMDDPQFRVRFEREARIIARLEHPAIVPVYDVGEDNGQLYFVMRYMSGGSLADRLKQGPLSLAEALRILEHLAPALDEAHAKGIIHRDIKPANILFDSADLPYLSDFGIAKMVTAQQSTLTGEFILGTPAYISPEQAQGKAVDTRSDIYSLGAILYQMLSGRTPYQADTPMSLALMHITEPPPDILQVNPSLPPALAALIRKAMAKKPSERFSTATEMVNALRVVAKGEVPPSLYQDLATEASPAAVTRVRAPKKPSYWPFVGIGALVLLLAAAAFLGWSALRAAPPAVPTLTLAPQPSPAATTTPQPLPPLPVAASPSPTSVPTETAIPSPTATAYHPPVIGGADRIALVASNEIWLVNVDGQGVEQMTQDRAAKRHLQWLPDRKRLLYLTGKCINILNTETKQVNTLTCLDGVNYFDGLRLSPDGKWLALSLDRELYIVPFEPKELIQVRNRNGLRLLIERQGCRFYNDVAVKDIRWARQGLKMALQILGVSGSRHVDAIVLYDFRSCTADMPFKLDEFPAQRFSVGGYGQNPILPSYDWDGEILFVLNGFRRNEGFGDLYEYNAETHKGKLLNPIENTCCYRDARFSPDGHYLIFAFQDIRQGAAALIQVYYVQYGTLGTGMAYTPLPLPPIFTRPDEKPQFALRPAATP